MNLLPSGQIARKGVFCRFCFISKLRSPILVERQWRKKRFMTSIQVVGVTDVEQQRRVVGAESDETKQVTLRPIYMFDNNSLILLSKKTF